MEGDGAGVADDAGLILISFNCRLVNDQSAMASGKSMQRKKVARLWASAGNCSRASLLQNFLHDSLVQWKAYLPSFSIGR